MFNLYWNDADGFYIQKPEDNATSDKLIASFNSLKPAWEAMERHHNEWAKNAWACVVRNGKATLVKWLDLEEGEKVYFDFSAFPTEAEMFAKLQEHIADDDEIAKAWRPYEKVD